MTTRDHKHHQRKRRYPRASIREQALVARCADLEAQLETALRLLHEKGARIEALDRHQQIRERVEARLRKAMTL